MDVEELFAALESQPIRLANLQASAAKQIADSEALGYRAVRIFSDVIDLADQMLKIMGTAGSEKGVFEQRLSIAVQAVGMAVSKAPITAERHAVVDPFFAACGFVPKP
jgi:hypothetical protein